MRALAEFGTLGRCFLRPPPADFADHLPLEHEQVVPAPRSWEKGYRSRVGEYGLVDGELPTGTLPDEILTPGKGQVKALLVHGGNPVSAIPDQRRVVRAFVRFSLGSAKTTVEPTRARIPASVAALWNLGEP